MKVHMNQKIALLIVLVVVSAQSFIFFGPLISVIVASTKLLAASAVTGIASGVTTHVINNAMKKTYRPKSVQRILEGIQHYITSTPALNDRASFGLISEQIKQQLTDHTHEMCDSIQFDQKILYKLHNILLTEMLSFITKQYFYLILTLHGKGNYTGEMKLGQKRYKTSTLKSLRALTQITKNSSRELRRCDPPVHIPGTTYLEICICDEAGPHPDRYFSVDAAMSNKEENYVVTGLRFVKRNNIIHLQVQEGKLLPYGTIETESIRWVPVRDTQLNDTSHYRTLSLENRSIDLGDIIASRDELLIGVSLLLEFGHIGLEIISSKFNFETGKLNISDINVAKYPNTGPRTKINLDKPDVPTRFQTGSNIYSGHNQYIEFTNTVDHFKEVPATVPFFDAQPVVFNPVIPLVGAGLYHKRQEKSGGFIAPKIITADFNKYVKFPNEEV